MKVVVCTKYGSPEVLQFKELEKPLPEDNEALIKAQTTTVHIGDSKVRRLEPSLGSNKVNLKFPEYWVPIAWNNKIKHTSKVEFKNEIVFNELKK